MSFSWALAGANQSSTTAPPWSHGTGGARAIAVAAAALVATRATTYQDSRCGRAHRSETGAAVRRHAKLDRRAGTRHARPALRGTLAAASAQLLETESLARLRDDVPLPSGARAAPVGAEAWSRMRALFVEWEFDSLLTRIDQLARPEPPSQRACARWRQSGGIVGAASFGHAYPAARRPTAGANRLSWRPRAPTRCWGGYRSTRLPSPRAWSYCLAARRGSLEGGGQ